MEEKEFRSNESFNKQRGMECVKRTIEAAGYSDSLPEVDEHSLPEIFKAMVGHYPSPKDENK